MPYKSFFITLLATCSSLVLNVPALHPQQDIGCDIGVIVIDADTGEPIANTPVLLTSLTYGGSIAEYTNTEGVALFDMHDWPNPCPPRKLVCCPATWNAGWYRALGLVYCDQRDFYYDGTNIQVYLRAGDPCD